MSNILYNQAMPEKFLASDFDKTLANTSEPAPDGSTVETAYEYAIEKLAGKTALELYRFRGGVAQSGASRNRDAAIS